MRAFFDSVDRWIDDDNALIGMGKIMLVIVIALFLVFAPVVYFVGRGEDSAYSECLDSGRAWAITGGHHAPKVGWVKEYGCVNIAR